MLRKIGKALIYIVVTLCLIWGTLALYYSEIPFVWLRVAMASTFFFLGVWVLKYSKTKKAFLVLFVAWIAIIVYWSTIQPSNDRVWRSDTSQISRVFIDGDNIRITNYRNFDYKSLDDFTVRYEDREVQLSHLTSLDFFVSYWMPGPVAHTFVSFNFDNAPPISISIEARFEEHESYDPLASLFKQFELIYIVGDERDIVRVRTNFRQEDVYLYHVNISPERARLLFMVYLERINELADHAEFYHLLSNNCTINILRYANKSGREGSLDIRHILNGFSDRYLYRAGLIDTSLPFSEIRENARINDKAMAANNDPDFSLRIRE